MQQLNLYLKKIYMKIIFILFALFLLPINFLFSQINTDSNFEPPIYKLGNQTLICEIVKINYPKIYLDNDIEGTVVINMHIDSLGNLSNLEVSCKDSLFKKEVLKTYNKFTKWVPASQYNKPVDTVITHKINFRILKDYNLETQDLDCKKDTSLFFSEFDIYMYKIPILFEDMNKELDMKRKLDHVKYLHSQGSMEVDKKNYDKGLKILLKAQSYNVEYADLYYDTGLAYFKNGEKTKACEQWQKAINLGDEETQKVFNSLCK
jgi:tetratricopeptide (TPR) repeat protein